MATVRPNDGARNDTMGKLILKGDLLAGGLTAEDQSDHDSPSLRAGLAVGGGMDLAVTSVPDVPVTVQGGTTPVGVWLDGPIPEVPVKVAGGAAPVGVTVEGGDDDVGVTVQGGDEPILVRLAKLRFVPNLTLTIKLYDRQLFTLKLTGDAKLEPA